MVSGYVRSELKLHGKTKNGTKLKQHLGDDYSIRLEKHIETLWSYPDNLGADGEVWMTWENHGKLWHIDHILPRIRTPYSSMDEENFKRSWALDNLRPLSAMQNCAERDRRTDDQIAEIKANIAVFLANKTDKAA